MTSSALPLPGDAAAPKAVAGRLHALAERSRDADGAMTDAGLLDLARGGDREAFGVLVERHHRMLAGLIRQRLGPRGPVEDLLQEVFAKSLANLSRFGERSSFATWAGTIALNLATDWGRKESRRRRLAPVADVEQDRVPAPGSERPLRDIETREEAARARRHRRTAAPSALGRHAARGRGVAVRDRGGTPERAGEFRAHVGEPRPRTTPKAPGGAR